MLTKTNRKRILIYLAFAFGISWATGLAIYLTGGLENSPAINIAGTDISLSVILLATAYMFGPALANVLTRLLTHEGVVDLYLHPNFEGGRWKYYLAAWLLPGVLTMIGILVYFLLFPAQYDPQLNVLRDQIGSTQGIGQMNPWLVIILQAVQAILIAPLLNAIPTFGEEFGWRGYLQPKLMPLGPRRAILLTGLIWGIWHWPVILMGYNYGLDYAGAPWLGLLAMVIATISFAALFGWLTLRVQNVWPGVIGHGALNGIASLGLLFVKGSPNLLFGPAPVGLVGGIGFFVTAILILLSPRVLNPQKIDLQKTAQ